MVGALERGESAAQHYRSALRHAVIMFRVQSRAVAFGQAEFPDNPDEMILHHKTLEAMLDGTYWESLATSPLTTGDAR